MRKYSILLPIRRGVKYLESIVDTVLNQDFNDYELIISDNYSTDGCSEYLKNLKDKHIIVIKPPIIYSMSEHWEWLLRHAKGDWIIFLGVDDGFFSYSFELAEKLTEIATRHGIRTIMSKRAYYFWPGCETLYGNLAVSYTSSNRIQFLNTRLALFQSLIGSKEYFDLPQMYSNSLFNRSLLLEVIEKQGKVFTSITPDANLAAIACSIEKRYLFSHIPLGWIGSSPSSNGYSCFIKSNNLGDDSSETESKGIADDFYKLIWSSEITFDSRVGDAKYASVIFLFWEALLKTQKLRGPFINRIILSKTLTSLRLLKELADDDIGRDEKKISNLINIANTNDIDITILHRIVKIIKKINYIISLFSNKLVYKFVKKVYRYICSAFKNPNNKIFIYKEFRSEKYDITMQEANRYIATKYSRLKN